MSKENRTPADEQFDMIMSLKMSGRKNTAIDTGNREREIEAIWALNTFSRLKNALKYVDELENEISILKGKLSAINAEKEEMDDDVDD